MKGFTLTITSLCLLTTVACGCVARSLRQKAVSDKVDVRPVAPSSLSEYIRAVYKVSGESANKEDGRRAQLLAEQPELQDYVTRLQQNAADNVARSQLVAAYFDHQLYWAAYELLAAADAENPVDSETSLNLARLWDVWGQFDLALKYGERAVAAGDSSSRALEVVGRIHLHRNDPAAAISWYTRAADQGENARIRANLGYAYMLVSDWEKAKTNLEKAIALDGSLAEAHNNLAVVLLKFGDEKAALSELQKMAPAHVAFNNMGVLYLREQKLARAQELFEEALQLAPKYEIAQHNLTTVQALLPPVPVVEAALDTPPQNIKLNVNGTCPVVDTPTTAFAQRTQLAAAPIAVDFTGSRGMVETEMIPLVPRSGPQSMLAESMRADPVVSERLNLKDPEPGEGIEQEPSDSVTGKAENIQQANDSVPSALAAEKGGQPEGSEPGDATTFESNGMACMHSSPGRHQTLASMLTFDEQRLSMCGIVGLLLGTAAVALRRKDQR